MKVHPIPHAIIETKRSRFIQILHHCSVSWKITPLYYFSTNLIYFGQKEPIEVKFSGFWLVAWKFTKFLMSYLKLRISFSFLKFYITSLLWETNLLYFFSLNFIWVRQTSPSKCKISDFCMLTWNFTKFVFDKLLLLKVYKISTTK